MCGFCKLVLCPDPPPGERGRGGEGGGGGVSLVETLHPRPSIRGGIETTAELAPTLIMSEVKRCEQSCS